jgi:hypothetical protein
MSCVRLACRAYGTQIDVLVHHASRAWNRKSSATRRLYHHWYPGIPKTGRKAFALPL